MPVFMLDKEELFFPPPRLAEENGMLAIGGDLSAERLLMAYRSGIFPWFNPDEPVIWWTPDPRFVLFPEKIKISKSMRRIIRKNIFTFTFDQCFEEIIRACGQVKRNGQQGTWISEEIIETYLELYRIGFIHSVEVWEDDRLVGGLYGGAFGKCFFGESMFAYKNNASKYALIMLAKNLAAHDFELIDCQVYTPHLERMGAEMVPRSCFLERVAVNARCPLIKEDWNRVFSTSPVL